MEDDSSVTDSEIDQVSDDAATAAILRIPIENVPQDPSDRSRLLRARAGIIYGLHAVTPDGLRALRSKRVIHQHEKHLLTFVSSTPSYVGQTIQSPAIRMTAHASVKNGCNGVQDWHRKLKEERGKGVHIAMVVLESDIPGDEITSRERFYVEKYNTLHPNGANMQVPGHHGDYMAAEILVAKRHIASYNKIIRRIGSAESLVKNIFEMKKKKACEYYNAGFNDFDNWCRILSNNSDAEAEIVRKHDESWSELSWSERLGLLSHDPDYVRDFVQYCKTYSKRRAAWLHQIDFTTVYEHMKAWRISSIIETQQILQEYDKFEKTLSQRQLSERLQLRLPDSEQIAEVKYVLGYVLQKGDTEQAWKRLGFKSKSTGHTWLARWEADHLTSDVVTEFQEAIGHAQEDMQEVESAESARERKIADAEKIAAAIRSVGPKNAANQLALSKDQIYKRIKAYQQDEDTTAIMSNLPTANESKCIAKGEFLRRGLIARTALSLNIDHSDVTDKMVVEYKRKEAQLFRDRVTSIGRGHAAKKYKVGESTMRTWAKEYKEDTDTADIMEKWPTSKELNSAARAATRMIESDDTWLDTIA